MQTFSTLPAAEGFRMPAEYEPHRGCVMIWPVRPGSWLYGGRDAQPAFAQAARAIAESETVWMLAGPAVPVPCRRSLPGTRTSMC